MFRRLICTTGIALWVLASAACFARLWNYEAVEGAAAVTPSRWPRDTTVSAGAGLPTLVLLMHPKCPCSRATVEELAKLMAQGQGKLVARVLMIRPSGKPQEWERTDNWQSAAAIPGVTVMADVDGVECARFGAVTSGQALFYSTDGRLLFAGGITESRGHIGDNQGRALVLALARSELSLEGDPKRTPVFGCPLFSESRFCRADGTGLCRK